MCVHNKVFDVIHQSLVAIGRRNWTGIKLA